MSGKSNSGSSGGIGLGGALLIVFVTLKLCNVIDWSWYWVLSPIWIPLSILLGVLLLVCLVFAIGTVIDMVAGRKKRR